jgi:hypothetical protein
MALKNVAKKPNLKQYHGICLKGISKTTKIQHSPVFGQDLNPIPPKYEAEC